MLKEGRGAIVNVAQKRRSINAGGAAAYAASKSAAAVALLDSLAADLKGSGVRVNSILPSIIDTEANRKAMPTADFSKWPKPEDIARVILFLCSDDAKVIHGAAIRSTGIVETSEPQTNPILARLDRRTRCKPQSPRSGWCQNKQKSSLAARFVAISPRRIARVARHQWNRRIRVRHHCGKSDTAVTTGCSLARACSRLWVAHSWSPPSTKSFITTARISPSPRIAWVSGAVEPQGFLLLEDFRLEGSTPVWTYALADAILEKRIWMREGENTTYVQYTRWFEEAARLKWN